MVQQMMAHLQGQRAAPIEEEAPPKQVRKTIRKKKEEYIEPESDSGESSSSYSSYESLEKIHKKFDDAPCEYISPAKLKEHGTKKDAIKYLASKACPEIPNLKKKAMSSMVVAAAPEATPVVKKVRKVKAAAPAPAPAPEPEVAPSPKAPAPRPKKVKAPVEVAPVAAPAPAAAAPKAKRPASEYAKLVGKYRKEKMSFADASKRAKAECDAKKKKD